MTSQGCGFDTIETRINMAGANHDKIEAIAIIDHCIIIREGELIHHRQNPNRRIPAQQQLYLDFNHAQAIYLMFELRSFIISIPDNLLFTIEHHVTKNNFQSPDRTYTHYHKYKVITRDGMNEMLTITPEVEFKYLQMNPSHYELHGQYTRVLYRNVPPPRPSAAFQIRTPNSASGSSMFSSAAPAFVPASASSMFSSAAPAMFSSTAPAFVPASASSMFSSAAPAFVPASASSMFSSAAPAFVPRSLQRSRSRSRSRNSHIPPAARAQRSKSRSKSRSRSRLRSRSRNASTHKQSPSPIIPKGHRRIQGTLSLNNTKNKNSTNKSNRKNNK